MLALDKLDVAIPAQYMKTAEAIMRHGDDNVPEYMIYLQTGDFANCPEVFLMYGTDECLYAVAPFIEAALNRGHVDYEINVLAGDWK